MDMTPVLIGVGEDFDATNADPASAKSNVDLAVNAARAAISDAGGRDVARAIDALVAVRTYPDSTPFWPHPIVSAKNFPRAVARRLGIAPARTFYELVGGQSPQRLVGEFAGRLARGEFGAVLIVGGEAIATEKAAQRAGVTLDWSDEAEGEVEDRGLDVSGLLSGVEIENDLVEIGAIYALFENARRARLGLSREAYARDMGALFAPFSDIAARRMGALQRHALSASDIAAISDANPMMFEPLSKAVIAKDGVNMGAAVLMTTAGRARALCVAEDRWVYLHGHCDLAERPILERPDLGCSPALRAAYETAIARAGVGADAIRHLDFYSCFPIAVYLAREAMGIAPDDPRPLTMTGGLPFFGGPGNNYSMHALAAMTRALREDRAGFGLVGANGGFLTKHAVGVYSATAPLLPWTPADDAALQSALDDARPAPWVAQAKGEAVVETYTIAWRRGTPVRAHAVARLKGSGARCLAVTEQGDASVASQMAQSDPLGATIRVTPADRGNRFAF